MFFINDIKVFALLGQIEASFIKDETAFNIKYTKSITITANKNSNNLLTISETLTFRSINNFPGA